MADINPERSEVDLCDEAVRVALDIEYSESADRKCILIS
jgi:hypothetical protein